MCIDCPKVITVQGYISECKIIENSDFEWKGSKRMVIYYITSFGIKTGIVELIQ